MEDLVLTTAQQGAVKVLLDRVKEGAKIASMSGAAGCGKTTSLIELKAQLPDAVVVTPTNKAAGVLQSKGVEASTLYAKFFSREERRDKSRKSTYKGPERRVAKKSLKFVPNYLIPSLGEGKIGFAEVIVVDEASMLNSWALGHLRKMCDTLILVGDANQLPPVADRDNPRGFFCTREHDVHLSEVLRNDGEILRLATAIRTSTNGIKLAGISVDDFYPEENFETLLLLDRPQLICWRNIIRQALNLRAREVLGLGTDLLPVPGDLMVCRSNTNERLLNGTQATVIDFTWSGASRFANVVLDIPGVDAAEAIEMDMVWFLKDQQPIWAIPFLDNLRGIKADEEDGLQLTYGYAVTAHTAQGGEWPAVCVVDERQPLRNSAGREFERDPRCVPADDACRRWFYTACTRAQTSLFIVDTRWTKY